MRNDEFIGGEFTWFTGIVKDINDTEYLNRVKVNCLGFYDDAKDDELPWATVMMPATSASIKGVGMNHNLQVGSWVVGFFRDGPSAQDPVVMGSIATQTDGTKDIPTEAQVSGNTNHVYRSQSGHVIEVDNTLGSERINIKHKSGTTINIPADGTVFINSSNITVDITGNTTIHGDLTITGKTHSVGDVSTEAGNSPTLATHVHEEIPGTGGSGSPSPSTVMTSKPFAGGTTVTYLKDEAGNEIPNSRTVNPPSGT